MMPLIKRRMWLSYFLIECWYNVSMVCLKNKTLTHFFSQSRIKCLHEVLFDLAHFLAVGMYTQRERKRSEIQNNWLEKAGGTNWKSRSFLELKVWLKTFLTICYLVSVFQVLSLSLSLHLSVLDDILKNHLGVSNHNFSLFIYAGRSFCSLHWRFLIKGSKGKKTTLSLKYSLNSMSVQTT